MKKLLGIILVVFCFISCISQEVHSSLAEVTKINIPNLDGYVTLLCDFHTHTAYSDGRVLPTVRVEEAYFNGLDAVAITDHIEHRRWRKYKSTSHNTSYQAALTSPKAKDVIVIKGCEITRSMPPGHFNAFFISDTDALVQENYIDVFKTVKEQNGFLSWNHPGWKKHLLIGILFWWPEHTALLEQGLMNGIEVVSGGKYSPDVHQWCIENNLTILSGTDVHKQLKSYPPGKHRTMTLIFAKEKSTASIREALFDRRTAVYLKDLIIGEDKYLRQIFEKSLDISVLNTEDEITQIKIKNNSGLIFELKRNENIQGLTYLSNARQNIYAIRPNSERTINVKIDTEIFEGEIDFTVENFLVGPNIKMRYTLTP